MKFTFFPVVVLFLFGCKKDCLKKGECELSTYESSFVVTQVVPTPSGTAYYIDTDSGAKDNSGTSPDDPFKEIKNLKNISFSPGDQILFKRGQVHYGELFLTSGGTEDNRIYIADYGNGSLPVVKSRDGAKGDAVTIGLNKANYVSILNLNVQGGIQSIQLSNSNYVIVAGCRIGEQANSGMEITGQYSEGNGSNYGEIHHCLFDSGIRAYVGDRQSTDGLKIIDGGNGWHVHHNEFMAWAHSAINVKQIYTLNSSNDNIFEYNTINCAPVDYMRAFDFAGGDKRVQNNIIRYNIINDQSVTSHIDGNDNTLAFNLFISLKESDATDQPWAIDLHVFKGNLGGEERDRYVCYNNKIHHNLIYNYQNGTGVKVYRSSNGTNFAVNNNEIKNNIFYNCGKAIDIDDEPQGISVTHNLIYNPEGDESFGYNYGSFDLESFEALNGTNSHHFENNLIGDPLFYNSVLANFKLLPGSAAIGAGEDLGYGFDFEGDVMVGTPDCGPIQY